VSPEGFAIFLEAPLRGRGHGEMSLASHNTFHEFPDRLDQTLVVVA
jgi:hypothetical protein